MSQRDYLLSKFHIHGGVLTTGDMIKDIHLAAEYRRLLCELRKRGHNILMRKLERNLFEYRLQPPDDGNGQMRLAV